MKINYSFLLLILLSLYIGYFDYLLLFLLCLLIHEFGHIIFIIIFKVKINKFILSIYGGLLELDTFTFNSLKIFNKILIYIGGILLNLLFFLWFNDTLFGKYNLILFIFNLIPVYPLDGFNILELIINKRVLNNLSVIFLLLLLIVSVYNNSLGLVFITSILIIKNIKYYKSKDKIFLLKLINNMV